MRYLGPILIAFVLATTMTGCAGSKSAKPKLVTKAICPVPLGVRYVDEHCNPLNCNYMISARSRIPRFVCMTAEQEDSARVAFDNIKYHNGTRGP